MKQLIFIVVLLGLTGCAPTAFMVGAGVGATAGGAVVYDNRGMNTIWEDNNISYQAQIRINCDPKLKHQTNISVATFDHVVLLVGEAPTEELRTYAENLVKQVPNIKRICNQITIGEPILTSTHSSDTWITTKVRSEMLTQKGLKSTQMKVVTENGVVYLMGLTTPSQGRLAAETARKVAGVRKVVEVFEYVH
jgi:osmotically-inducible protein OsmY